MRKIAESGKSSLDWIPESWCEIDSNLHEELIDLAATLTERSVQLLKNIKIPW
ncbi:hypothetical protein ACQ4M3_26205 [Leptolyngbya sp. AN03gr2]|uniref:hypothetical protein n=1 Tax=unclassified Leptolyngbya TaxID=2650499 RepID=UPI003D3128BC